MVPPAPASRTLSQLATGASRFSSKLQWEKKALKLVRGAKCVSGCCGVPDADMTCLILGGGQRGGDASLPVVGAVLQVPVLLVLVPVVWLCVPERAVQL